MRIGFLTHQWPGVRLGGIGAYTVHAARALARAGCEVHVFTFTLPGEVREGLRREGWLVGEAGRMPAPQGGVVVHEVPVMAGQVGRGVAGAAAAVGSGGMSAEMGMALMAGGEGMYRLGMGWLLCEAVWREEARLRSERRGGFDVVEGPEYEALGLPLVMMGFEGAVVTQLHSGSAIGRMVGNISAGGDQGLKELLELAVIAGADGVCAPSRAAIEDTRAAYGMVGPGGMLAERAEALALPFEVEGGEFGPPPRDGAVLYIGRLEWLKGAHVLVEAANIFLREHAGARVRVVGPDTQTGPESSGSMLGWMKKNLRADVAQRMEFLGEMNREGMQKELKGCSFVVVPSLSETYSYVCCEAMAAGRAVVVSEGIGATEVVGEAGRRFRKGDAGDLARVMGEMWRDAAGREELGRKAFLRARGELSGQTVIAKRVDFYERVIAERAAAGGGGREKGVRAVLGPAADALEGLMRALGQGDAKSVMAFADWYAPNRPETPGMRVVKVLQGRGRGVKFYLYGAGRHTVRLLVERPRWEAAGQELAGIIDDHPRFKEAAEFMGLSVMSCAAAGEKLGGGDVVILSTDAMEELFWRQTAGLRERGVAVFRLYGK